MTLLLVLSAPLFVMVVARWVWRFHLRALQALGPGLGGLAGASAAASMAEVVSVLVEDDTVLVGLRPYLVGSRRGSATIVRAPVTTEVLSVEGQGCEAIARLERWQASGAPVLMWRDGAASAIELRQLHTGQRLRLPIVSTTTDNGHPASHTATT